MDAKLTGSPNASTSPTKDEVLSPATALWTVMTKPYSQHCESLRLLPSAGGPPTGISQPFPAASFVCRTGPSTKPVEMPAIPVGDLIREREQDDQLDQTDNRR